MRSCTNKHNEFLKKIGANKDKLRSLSDEDGERFICEVLVPYVCGKGTKEEENIADDIIGMMTE